jgi:hypothetical protein
MPSSHHGTADGSSSGLIAAWFTQLIGGTLAVELILLIEEKLGV